jgi:ATP-dependent helicase/nuclease subunit B
MSRECFIDPEVLALPAAQTLVLSPSDRARRGFARVWAHELQQSNASSVVQMPRFETLKSHFAHTWNRAQLYGTISDERALIAPPIEAALWRHVASEIAATSRTESAALALRFAEAWSLENGYRESGSARQSVPFANGASGELYRAARSAFVTLLRRANAITASELPAALASLLDTHPEHTHQQILVTPYFSSTKIELAFLSKYNKNRINVHCNGANDRIVNKSVNNRIEFADVSAERDAVIDWAAAMLDSLTGAQTAQIAIVVPNLSQTRGIWQRALTEAGLRFNVSLGSALSQYPWAAAGFCLVSALFSRAATETVAQALRHPRWGRTSATIAAIDRRERRLLENNIRDVTLFEFLEREPSEQGDPLARLLTQVNALRDVAERTRAPQPRMFWRGYFERAIVSFADASVPLDSKTFQLRDALIASIERWQQLDDLLPHITIAAAQQELIALSDEAAFQPEGSDAPLQVIGLLESAGVPFDAMWVTGLSDRVLPEPVHINPFLSSTWQRNQRVGLASIEEAETRAQHIVDGWQRLVKTVTLSLPNEIDGERKSWSPLVTAWPKVARETPKSMQTKRQFIVSVEDEAAPPWIAPAALGVRAFEAQALCPRRGFSEARLRLNTWPKLTDGLSHQARGELVHAVAEKLGHALKSGPMGLDALDDALGAYIDAAVASAARQHVRIPEHVWRAEKVRLQTVFSKFIDAEKNRPTFHVADVEHKVQSTLGALSLSLRIDRVDNVDRVDEDTGEIHPTGIALVDFKSGHIARRNLFDDRLTAPQLPLYAHAMGIDRIDAVAYARVTDDAQDIVGVGTERSGFAPSKRVSAKLPSWREIRDGWRLKLEVLASELVDGEAHLAPADGKKTCERCDFQRFCRIDLQRLNTVVEGDDDDRFDVESGVE